MAGRIRPSGAWRSDEIFSEMEAANALDGARTAIVGSLPSCEVSWACSSGMSR